MGYQAVAAPGNVSAVHLDGQCIHFRVLLYIAEESGISTIKRLFSTYLDKMVQGGVKYHK